jgi:hypothetical protein
VNYELFAMIMSSDVYTINYLHLIVSGV